MIKYKYDTRKQISHEPTGTLLMYHKSRHSINGHQILEACGAEDYPVARSCGKYRGVKHLFMAHCYKVVAVDIGSINIGIRAVVRDGMVMEATSRMVEDGYTYHFIPIGYCRGRFDGKVDVIYVGPTYFPPKEVSDEDQD